MVGWLAMHQAGPQSGEPLRQEPITIGRMIEAEDLQLTNQGGQFNFWLQPTSSFGEGVWSKGAHMFADRSRLGDWVEWVLPPTPAAEYQFEVFLTRARDYGVVQMSLNGTPIGEEIDLFVASGVVPTGAIDLGRVRLHEGSDILRLQVKGTNPSSVSPHYQLGIDGIRIVALLPSDSATPAESSGE